MPQLFVSKQLAHALLACTAIGVAAFVLKWCAGGGGFRSVFGVTRGRAIDSSRAIVLALFSSQLVGVVFSRTIHYQVGCMCHTTAPQRPSHVALPACLPPVLQLVLPHAAFLAVAHPVAHRRAHRDVGWHRVRLQRVSVHQRFVGDFAGPHRPA